MPDPALGLDRPPYPVLSYPIPSGSVIEAAWLGYLRFREPDGTIVEIDLWNNPPQVTRTRVSPLITVEVTVGTKGPAHG